MSKMVRRTLGVFAGACALTTLVSAQGTGTSAQTNQRNDQTVTATGCLQQASGQSGTGTTAGSPAGTGGTAATSGASGARSGGGAQFMLNNARLTSGSGAATGTTAGGSTSGTAAGTGTTSSSAGGGTSATANAGKMYMIVGQEEELRKHINHQVEVQGRLEGDANRGGANNSAGGPGTTGTGTSGTGTSGTGTSATGTTGSGRASGMSGDHQTIRATTVRMISASCTP